MLVHCAQGKSRSAVICISYLALLRPSDPISNLTQEVKSKRNMAEPNCGFFSQLKKLQKDGFFQKLHEKLKIEEND